MSLSFRIILKSSCEKLSGGFCVDIVYTVWYSHSYSFCVINGFTLVSTTIFRMNKRKNLLILRAYAHGMMCAF